MTYFKMKPAESARPAIILNGCYSVSPSIRQETFSVRLTVRRTHHLTAFHLVSPNYCDSGSHGYRASSLLGRSVVLDLL